MVAPGSTPATGETVVSWADEDKANNSKTLRIDFIAAPSCVPVAVPQIILDLSFTRIAHRGHLRWGSDLRRGVM